MQAYADKAASAIAAAVAGADASLLASTGFTLAQAGPTRLAVYDLLGREVAVLADGQLAEGRHEVHLDAGALASGTYVYRLQAGTEALTGRMTVTR